MNIDNASSYKETHLTVVVYNSSNPAGYVDDIASISKWQPKDIPYMNTRVNFFKYM